MCSVSLEMAPVKHGRTYVNRKNDSMPGSCAEPLHIVGIGEHVHSMWEDCIQKGCRVHNTFRCEMLAKQWPVEKKSPFLYIWSLSAHDRTPIQAFKNSTSQQPANYL